MGAIEWTGRTWNPTRGCSVVSPGCANCYAMRLAHRFSGPGGRYEGLTYMTPTRGPQWTGTVRVERHRLLEPLGWRRPATVFVDSMSDLFHEGIDDEAIADVFGVMALAHWHQFQILTKRVARARAWLTAGDHGVIAKLQALAARGGSAVRGVWHAIDVKRRDGLGWTWPLPNVWIGASVEDQTYASARIPDLLATPAALRFVSCEPLLWPLALRRIEDGAGVLDALTGARIDRPGAGPRLDWVIVGGESGPHARPCALNWIDRIVRDCAETGVPVFVKQLGAFVVDEARTVPAAVVGESAARRQYTAPDGRVWAWRMGLGHARGGDPEEWPAPLRVRQMPDPAGVAAHV